MFSFLVGVCFAVVAANAHFHHKFHHQHHHFTYDTNGFKGHHKVFGGSFGPHPPQPVYGPSPRPVYGPPPPPSPSFHYPPPHGGFPGYPDRKPVNQHNFGENFGFPNLMPFNPFISPIIPFNLMNPTIPISSSSSSSSINSLNIDNVHNFHNVHNVNNHHFSSVNVPINISPNSNGHDIAGNPSFTGANIPSNFPSDLPNDPLPISPSTYDVNTPVPLDANTVFDHINVHSSTSATNIVPLNVDNQPQNGLPINSPNTFEGSTEATNQITSNPKIDQNNANNYNGGDAFVPNHHVDINNQAIVPDVNEPEVTTTKSSTQGNVELIYDIDVRFGDADNRTNQKPLDTIK